VDALFDIVYCMPCVMPCTFLPSLYYLIIVNLAIYCDIVIVIYLVVLNLVIVIG